MSVNLNLSLRGGTYYVTGRVQIPGQSETKRVRKSTGYGVDHRAEANVVLHRIAGEYADTIAKMKRREGAVGAVSDVTVGAPSRQSPSFEYVSDLVDEYRRTGPKVGATTQGTLKRFREAMGGERVVGLDYMRLHRWFHRLDKFGRRRKPGTVNREIADVRAVFNFCRSLDDLVPDFAWKREEVDDARTRWLTVEERDRFLGCFAEDEGRELAAFLFMSGSRIGNAIDLRWEQVVLGESAEASLVRLWSKKGKAKKLRWRSVPMAGGLYEMLKGVRDRRGHEECVGDAHVFLRPEGTPWGDAQHFRRAYWNLACAKAGIEDFVPHDARHTFCSHLVQKGVPLVVVMELVGHSNMSMVQRYAHLAPSHHQDAVQALSASSWGVGFGSGPWSHGKVSVSGKGVAHEPKGQASSHPGDDLRCLTRSHTLPTMDWGGAMNFQLSGV